MPTSSYDTATAELAMTLSTLAYVDENRTATQQQMIGEINAALDEAGYPSWRVVWGPALNADRSNLLYAARNSQTGQLAVSIRGSDFSFWLNWIEDLAVLRVVPTTNSYRPPATRRRSRSVPPSGSGRYCGRRTERKALKHF